MRVKMIIEEEYNGPNFVILYFKNLNKAIKVMREIFENGNEVSIVLYYVDNETLEYQEEE